MEQNNWAITANRFVAFFDIMGFKDLVERNSHKEVVDKLNTLKNALKTLEIANVDERFKKYDMEETKSITFSDSIIIFSKSDTIKDAKKILLDSAWIVNAALQIGLGIKGAISHGEITVDFRESLFFGRPIIDSFLLQDQLHLYAAILDNNFEKKINAFSLDDTFKDLYISYKACIKTGKVSHNLICPPKVKDVQAQIGFTNKIYEAVSGSPRIYVDNTLDFLDFVLKEKNKKEGNES